MNNITKKIIISAILIFAILSTAITIKSNAFEISSTSTYSIYPGKLIPKEELGYVGGNPSLLCSSANIYFPLNVGQTAFNSSDSLLMGQFGDLSNPDLYKEGKVFLRDVYQYKYDPSGKLVILQGTNMQSRTSITGSSQSLAKYDVITDGLAGTPAEVYILAHIGSKDPVEVQNAWWSTPAGGGGSGDEWDSGHAPGNNSLSAQAYAFQEYIKSVGGSEKCSTTGFGIKYKPEWVTQEEIIVGYDQDITQYIVGPFELNYVNAEPFAGIKDMNIYGDNNQLIDKEDWKIIYKNGDKAGQYPDGGQQFYLKIRKLEWLTKITNIKVDFHYMDGAGFYQKAFGYYYEASFGWERIGRQVSKINNDTVYTDIYEYKMKNVTKKESQRLAVNAGGKLWDNEVTLEWIPELHPDAGTVQITKKVIDENGNELKIKDDSVFKFELSINGKQAETITVKAGETAVSQVYSWIGSPAPTFTIKELKTDGYRIKTINGIATNTYTGNLSADNTIAIEAVNQKIPDEGKLKIIKNISEEGIKLSQEGLAKLKDIEYEFKVSITGDFEYNGKKYSQETPLEPIIVKVKPDAPVYISGIKWYGEAPKYSVEELPNEYTTQEKLVNASGTLIKDKAIEIECENKAIKEEGKIKIIKTLENSDKLSKEEIEATTFKFILQVEGHDEIEITLKDPILNGDIWEWTYESDTYQWNKIDGAPKYTIRELEQEGFEIVSINGTNGNTFEGTLSSGSTEEINITEVSVINKAVRHLYDGKIKIKKEIADKVLENKDYKFVVILTSEKEFTYTPKGGAVMSIEPGKKLQLTNDSAFILAENGENNYEQVISGGSEEIKYNGDDPTKYVVIHIGENETANEYISGTVSWYGEKDDGPTYTVEEYLLGEDILASVNPGTGIINGVEHIEGVEVPETENTIVNVKNFPNEPDKYYRVGYLHIIKTLIDADKYDVEEIKDIIFRFKLTLGNSEPVKISLEPKLIDNTWVWEYTSDKVVWEVDEKGNLKEGGADKFTLEEIDIPEGMDYVSATIVTDKEGNTTKTEERIITGTLIPAESQGPEATEIEFITTDVSVINKLIEKEEGKLTINKHSLYSSLKDKEFDFTIKLKGKFFIVESDGTERFVDTMQTIPVKVKGEERKDVVTVRWYKGSLPPTYEVTEEKSDIATLVSVENVSGSFSTEIYNIVATFTNDVEIPDGPEDKEGTFVVKKLIKDDKVDYNSEFEFQAIIDYGNGKTETENFKIHANASYGKEIVWEENDPVPTVTITEVNIPEGYKFLYMETDNESGTQFENGTKFTLSNNNSLRIFVTNEGGGDEPVIETGGFRITKQFKDSKGDMNEKFEFKTEIKYGNGKTDIENFVISAYESYEKTISWPKVDGAPIITITEENIPEGYTIEYIGEGTSKQGNSATFRLVGNQVLNIVAENKADKKHKGTVEIIKNIITGKNEIDSKGLANKEFSVQLTISSDEEFEVDGKVYGGDNYYYNEFPITIQRSWKSPEVIWYGDKAPTVNVKEDTSKLDLKYWKEEVQYSGINGSGKTYLVEDKNVSVTITNEPRQIISLLMNLGGMVWEDIINEELGKNVDKLGKYDNDEKGLPNVEVYVYRALVNDRGIIVRKDSEPTKRYANLYKAEASETILTDSNGNWKAPFVEVPSATDAEKAEGLTATYVVDFVYDGQTYEPTTFLKTSNGDASIFKNANTAGKDAYANDSMALDVNRDEVNKKLSTIEGKTSIDNTGYTSGTAISTDGRKSDIEYKANIDSGNKVISKLITKNQDGTTKDLFKAIASTMQGDLAFPLPNANRKLALYAEDFSITESGDPSHAMYYKASYNHCLHINLGLVKRPEADLTLIKDLESAKVTVRGEEKDYDYNYKFNTLADIKAKSNGEPLERQVEIIANEMGATEGNRVNYQLGLYKSDYYYRAEMYKSDSTVYSEVVARDLQENGSNSNFAELEIELNYKIAISNLSPTSRYTMKVYEIADYYDSTFKIKSVKDEKGNNLHYEIEQAKGVYTEHKGTDGVTYKKMIIKSDANKSRSIYDVNTGEIKYIDVTVAVKKGAVQGVHDAVILGEKSNIAEITSYGTYNKDTGAIEGKIDRNSAPDNINIKEHNGNRKKDLLPWYEDDTDDAPILKLKLLTENITKARTVEGIAWQDKQKDDAEGKEKGIGDGQYTEGEEALIAGLTTQLFEKVKGSDGTEYDFLLPTNEQFNSLGNRTLKSLTDLNTTTETARGKDAGSYIFNSVPKGEYIVRFTYGNDKTKLEDLTNITGPAIAVNMDGTKFSKDDKILTANYKEYEYGQTPAVYNGQDYKATIYQSGGDYRNEYNNLEKSPVDSDARDNEARRLLIIANSETISNTNGNILSSANYNEKTINSNLGTDHTELYRDYYMFSDTAKLDLSEENLVSKGIGQKEEGKTTKVIREGSANVTVTNVETNTNYPVTNVNIALIERPESANIVLDKQIKSIKLTTNDGKEIFNAIYDIEYKQVDNLKDNSGEKKVVVFRKEAKSNEGIIVEAVLNKDLSTGLEAMQALNKAEEKSRIESIGHIGTQNFRFINIDEDILQGTTITIDYEISALNFGQVDYISSDVNQAIIKQKGNVARIKEYLIKKSKVASEATYDEIGQFLGESYYTGNGENDAVVTTRVRQIIDYVDNDAAYEADINSGNNHLWRTTNLTELRGNGLERNRLIDMRVIPSAEILDSKYRSYKTAQRDNLILSVDDLTSIDSNNAEFEKMLQPYYANSDEYKSTMTVTVEKVVSSGDDSKTMNYDNLSEIVKVENTAGRRDVIAIPGNSNPKEGEFKTSITEKDASSPELVTLTPPTGLEVRSGMIAQILIASLIALIVVAIGTVVIKKKVLTK